MNRLPAIAVLRTLAYADVFSFPFSSAELTHWLIGVALSEQAVRETLRQLTGNLSCDGYWFGLGDVEKKAKQRAKRQIISVQKMKRAREAASVIKLIPSIRLVGVSGSVATGNAAAGDDIDLFIITAPGTLFTSRAAVIAVTELFYKRRRPGQLQVADSVCLNMFADENNLTLPQAEQDLFAAHELLQMKPVFIRGGVLRSLLTANSWVEIFLPNAWSRAAAGSALRGGEPFFAQVIILLIRILEPLVRKLSLSYMAKKQTTETVTPGYVRFHPQDARKKVSQAYLRRLLSLNIPLDNTFHP